jgi:hypothetical protein
MNLSDAEERLRPATAASGTAELMACLTLVAPTGMSAEDRDAWVKVARATLSGMPRDLLAVGCKEARKRCRFASEIVPAITETVEAEWERRKRTLEWERAAYANRHAPKLASKSAPPEYIRAEEVRKLIKSLGRATHG